MTVDKYVTGPAARHKCPRCPNHSRHDDRYEVHVHNPSGRDFRSRVHGYEQAQTAEAEKRLEFRSGGGLTYGQKRTVAELLAQILADNPRLAPNTLEIYGRRRRVIEAQFGQRQVASLQSQLEITSFFGQVRLEHGREMGFGVEMLMRRLIRTAIGEGLLTRDPLFKVRRTKRVAVRGNPYVPKMVDAVRTLDWIAPRKEDGSLLPRRRLVLGDLELWTALLHGFIGTGVRIGEMLALDPADIDRDAGVWMVSRQLSWLNEERVMVFGPLKDDDGVERPPRAVPLPRFVLSSFAVQQLRNGTRRTTLPWRTTVGPLAGEHRTYDLLFHRVAGKVGLPLMPDTVRARMASIGVQAGLPERLHPHSFRHLYTSVLANAGVPQVAIDSVTGHKPTGGIAATNYTWLLEEGLEKVVPAIDAAWTKAQTRAGRITLSA